MRWGILLVVLVSSLVLAQNLAWTPVLGTKQIWRISIAGTAEFQLTLGNKSSRGFFGTAVASGKNYNAEVYFRPKEDTLELTISPTPGTYACTFTGARSVKGLSFVGTAYYLPPNAVNFQNLQRTCEMSYLDPNLRGAPVPALGGAPVPALGGAPVPALGGVPISAENLNRLTQTQVARDLSTQAINLAGRPWQPSFNLGQTWDVTFMGIGTWAVNLVALEQNIPYGFAVGSDTRVGLGLYVTQAQAGIGSDLAIFAVGQQTEVLYCVLLPSGTRNNNTWIGIGAIQVTGKELVATGQTCQLSLRN